MFGLFRLLIPLFFQTVHKLSDHYYSLPEPKYNLENRKQEHDQQKRQEEIEILCRLCFSVEQHGQKESNMWCQLDTNLLGDIMSRLCLTDQARFRAVCKNWLAAHPITPAKYLPWSLYFDRVVPTVSNMLEFRLNEPSSAPNLAASVVSISLTELGIPSPHSYLDIAINIVHDWIFISIGRPRWFFWTRKYLLLFSPLTKKIITLPKLDHPRRFSFFRTFSAEPDNPNCVFFLLDACNAGKIAIITYRNGDSEWTAREFDTVADFYSCSCMPVCLGGILYIVSPYGQLASYNIVDGEFKFESLVLDELFVLNHYYLRIYRVFELNGELMLIYFGCHYKEDTNYTCPGKECIKRYDWSSKVWIPVSTLGDKTLFVSDKFRRVATINKEDMRNNGVISNKIYRFYGSGCLIYTIEDGELVEFNSMNSNLPGGNLLQDMYNCGISSYDATKAIHWLNPPRVRY